MQSLISIFPSALASEPDKAIPLSSFLDDVIKGKWASIITPLREHIRRDDRVRYDAKKRLLPAVTISCHCLSRARELSPEAKSITHSGWLQADFDLADNPILDDPETAMAMRESLINDPYICAVFVGPSGQGLKAVVQIDPTRHKDSWFAAELYFKDKHNLRLDKATKDPMRLCFVSHDPLAEVSDSYTVLPVPDQVEVEASTWHPPIESTAEDIKEMLNYIPSRPDYDTWLRIASAVWSVLPMLEGAMLLNAWSPEERDGEYVSKHKARLAQIGVGTLAMMAAEHGFDAKEAYRRRRWAGRIRFADSERSPFHKDDAEDDLEPVTIEVTRERIMTAYRNGQIGDAALWCELRTGHRVWNIHAKMWMIYCDGIWRRDASNSTPWDISETLSSLYKSVISSIHDEIAANPPPDAKKDPREKEISTIQARVKSLADWSYVTCVEKFALRHLALPATDFDSNPEILVVENGTLDFKEGLFREHRPVDNATVRSPITFDVEAECPMWDAFLDRFIPDVETQQYLARAIGYSLTGLVNHDALFFSYGKGANGKSTFFGVLKILLGDLMTTVPIAALLAAKSDSNFDYHKASMEGKRVVLTDEIPEGRTLQDSQVKAITGGDAINARRPFENPYVFIPTHKLWLMGNHKPEVKGTDEGIWRRVNAIPFLVTIKESERRPRHELMTEFSREAAGILNWAIRGLIESRDIGLCAPEQVVEATREYREESDQFGTFLSECTDNDVLAAVKIERLSQAYKAWCERNSETPRYNGTRKIRKVMEERDYVIKPDRNKHPMVMALKLKDERYEDSDLI